MTARPPESESPDVQPVPRPQGSKAARPGGLTVMAVLNFIFGGLGMVALFVLMLAQQWLYKMTAGAALTWANYLMYVMRLTSIILAISSAIGYLRLHRFQGYVLGNAYACVAILNMVLYAVLLDEFGIMSFFWLMWPIVTLFLLNIVYRQAFVGGTRKRPSARSWVLAGAGLVGVAIVVTAAAMLSGSPPIELTDVRTVLAGGLAFDNADPDAKQYARNISFPKVTIKRSGVKELRLDFVVRNDNDMAVTRLAVEIALLDENGVQVAGRSDLFAHDSIFGENNTPVPAKGSKYAGCELKNPRQWKSGAVKVTITEIAVQQAPDGQADETDDGAY